MSKTIPPAVIKLVEAAMQDNLSGVQAALAEGAEADAQNNEALCWAVGSGNIEMAELLIAEGADINKQVEVGSMMHVAAREKKPEMITFLAAQGLDPNAESKDGLRPLYRACYGGRWGPGCAKTVKALLEAGANPDSISNDRHRVPLIETIRDRPEVVEALIEGGANLELKDKDSNTALIIAAQRESKDLMKQLIEAGADVYDTQRAFDSMEPKIAKYLKEEILRREEEAVRTGLTEDISAPKRIRVKKGGMQP